MVCAGANDYKRSTHQAEDGEEEVGGPGSDKLPASRTQLRHVHRHRHQLGEGYQFGGYRFDESVAKSLSSE